MPAAITRASQEQRSRQLAVVLGGPARRMHARIVFGKLVDALGAPEQERRTPVRETACAAGGVRCATLARMRLAHRASASISPVQPARVVDEVCAGLLIRSIEGRGGL